MSETALYLMKEGDEPVRTDFGGRYLAAYSLGEEFTAAVLLSGREIARGSGTSKKRAEQQAARAALLRVKRSGDWE